MPIDDPLFSREDLAQSSFVKPWWRHPALVIVLIVLLAAVLAMVTGKEPAPREAPPVEAEVPIEIRYVDEPTDAPEASPADTSDTPDAPESGR